MDSTFVILKREHCPTTNLQSYIKSVLHHNIGYRNTLMRLNTITISHGNMQVVYSLW